MVFLTFLPSLLYLIKKQQRSSKMVNQKFATEIKSLGFYLESDNSFNLTNRSKGYDNDCSDDERDDEFYEDRSSIFYNWARPIITKAKDIAKKHDVNVKIETSAEYGMIDVIVQ